MANFSSKLEKVLKTIPVFIDQDGQLLRTEVINAAYRSDPRLYALLSGDEELKKKFFFKNKSDYFLNIHDFVAYIQDKNFLNDSYTVFKNKVGLTIDDKFLNERKEVALVWPFKDCVLEGGQTEEDSTRKEIFFNKILAQDEIDKLLAPKVLTDWKRFIAKDGKIIDEKVNKLRRDEGGTIRDNFFIKGNNLLALHTLRTQFQGKVRLIYIDPPYNTGGDSFGYNDNFNHSTWLTFMKNRLEVARELLTEDGSIYVQADYNEIHYLKILLDSIFGRENFQREIIWDVTVLSGFKTIANNWIRGHETILYYSKSPKPLFNKLFQEHSEEYLASFNKADSDGRKFMVAHGLKRYLDITEAKGKPYGDVWNDVASFQQIPTAKERIDFSTQKTEKLLSRIIQASSNPGDIVLDFFSGSGTTLAVAHKLGRQWIGIEQIDNQVKILIDRLNKVLRGGDEGISKEVKWKGGGSFIYSELAKYNETFVEEIEKAKDTKTLLKIWTDMKQRSFLNYLVKPDEFDKNISEFKELQIKKQKQLLFELLNKNQLYLNLSEIKDVQFKVSKEDNELNKEFYEQQTKSKR